MSQKNATHCFLLDPLPQKNGAFVEATSNEHGGFASSWKSRETNLWETIFGKIQIDTQNVFPWNPLFQLDASKSLYRKWLFHQTSIYKWLFGVPGKHI